MDKERRKSSHSEIVKFLIGAVLLIGIIGGSVSVTFAHQDIQSLLMNWFDTQRGHALVEIKEAIDSEQEIQTGRLKEELHSEIQVANERLQAFTLIEKEKRTSELRRYVDELISTINIDNSQKENSLRDELESIFQAAVNEMNRVMNDGNHSQAPEQEPDLSDGEDPEEEPDSESELGPEPKQELKLEPNPNIDPDHEFGEKESDAP
ncbi:hypothetical protein [Sporosarcina highlanderae]|uniref:Uncharacterized protein n=1 Tax=Sporosarcina highlanderae TaxID=3035916 RepID=A0ABT8JUL5_9BACL|nr:hypothetical protein [Sporosarcina highlanderae]MDN4608072.1 hypothetical protein [Sporosarcina highlanderae]